MEKNQVDINLSTDIKTDNLVPLNITLMSRDINNNSFLLKFKSDGADVQLNNSFTVEILSVFPNSKIEILTQAVVYGNTAMWEFDTKYITRNEVVSNYVYVKKDGAPIISADANAFTFKVELSKIDGIAGKTAETYDRNYEKVLHEFEVAINLTKDEWAQMADETRDLVDETRDLVDGVQTNEITRTTNEANRITDENIRKANENSRVNAENVRKGFYEGFDGRLDDLSSLLGWHTAEDVVGLEADFENSIFTRLSGAVGLNAGSDFDKLRAFGGRRRCILSDSGEVLAYYGDANYIEDGSLGQVMVEQPKFYYKVVPLKIDPIVGGKGHHLRKARYYVSDTKQVGFKVHPTFVRNGKELNKIYLSAYEGSLYDVSAMSYISNDAQSADFATDKLSSIAGVMPISGLTQNLTRANARLLAQKRGEGWQQQYAATAAANQLLMLIEYGSLNMQTALGMGVTGKVDGGGNDAEPTGATASLGNKSGTAKTINNYDAVSYRGEETPYSNIYKYIDGLNVMANGLHDVYIADSGFADNKRDGNYKDAGFTLAKTTGYISAFGYSPSCDYLFLPSETLGNSALPVGDNFFQNANAVDQSGWRSVFLGGDSVSTTTAGPYYLWVANSILHKGRTISSRLVYVGGGN